MRTVRLPNLATGAGAGNSLSSTEGSEASGNSAEDLAGSPSWRSAVVKLDTRTPAEVIASIETQSQIVTKSLKTLRNLLKP